jgi:cell division protein FtsB
MLSKKGKKKFLYSAPVVILVVIISFGLLHTTISVYGKMKVSKEKRNLAEAELQELSRRYDSLDSKVAYLETEKGLEDAVRIKYNVVKEGEEVFVIIDDDVEPEIVADKPSAWTKFWSNVTAIFR